MTWTAVNLRRLEGDWLYMRKGVRAAKLKCMNSFVRLKFEEFSILIVCAMKHSKVQHNLWLTFTARLYRTIYEWLKQFCHSSPPHCIAKILIELDNRERINYRETEADEIQKNALFVRRAIRSSWHTQENSFSPPENCNLLSLRQFA